MRSVDPSGVEHGDRLSARTLRGTGSRAMVGGTSVETKLRIRNIITARTGL